MRKFVQTVVTAFALLVPSAHANSWDTGKIPQKVELTFPTRCMFGDLDAINFDSQYDNKAKFLLSIKSLQSGKEITKSILSEFSEKMPEEVPDHTKISLALDRAKQRESLLKNGAVVEVPLPDESFVISICKDGEGTNSCDRKKISDTNEILSKYQSEYEGVSPDSVYFYQVVHVSGGAYRVLNKVSDDSLSTELASNNVPQEIIQNLNVIQSLPMKLSANTLQIQLPFFDKQKCGQRAPRRK